MTFYVVSRQLSRSPIWLGASRNSQGSSRNATIEAKWGRSRWNVAYVDLLVNLTPDSTRRCLSRLWSQRIRYVKTDLDKSTARARGAVPARSKSPLASLDPRANPSRRSFIFSICGGVSQRPCLVILKLLSRHPGQSTWPSHTLFHRNELRTAKWMKSDLQRVEICSLTSNCGFSRFALRNLETSG
jgi:hypothetical protein